MPSRLDHIALYGVSIAAGLITGAVLVSSAGERPAIGARVYGYMAEGAERCSLRVHTRRHQRGSSTDFAAPLSVTVHAGGEKIGELETDAAVIMDVVVPLSRPADGALDVFVRSQGVELARVPVDLQPTLRVTSIPEHSREQSDAKLTVGLPRGIAVAELPEQLKVTVDVVEGAVPAIHAKATGADLTAPKEPAVACADARCVYTWHFSLTARAPTAELDLSVARGGAELVSWVGPINVVPGSVWLDPDSDELLKLRSAVPREEAYVSLLAKTGRFWGARVPLTTDDSGMSRGSVPRPELPEGPVVAVISGEPNEPESVSAPWPLRGEWLEGGRVLLLADGMSQAMSVEEQRQRDARRPAYGLIVASGIFELIYLWWRARRSRRRLETHLVEHVGGELSASQSMPLTALMLLSGALALAFAILATLSAFG
jgi:hypothetical protein